MSLCLSHASIVTITIKPILKFFQPSGSPIILVLWDPFADTDHDQILKSLHWLKVQEHIEYKIISITYKVLQSSSPHYLRDIITIQPSQSTRLSSLVTLVHPQAQSSLKITNLSFRYAAPHLWNKLPPSLSIPCQSATSECSPPSPGSDSAPKSVVGVYHRVFHSRLKTHLFSRSFPL